MKRTVSAICFLSLAACPVLFAQAENSAPINQRGPNQGGGRVVVPTSSIKRPEDFGLRAHTHHLIFIPNKPSEEAIAKSKAKSGATPAAGYYAETPASLACLYGETLWTAGCNPYSLANSNHATGGSKAIAVVDAYDYPTALHDLNMYSSFFGIPQLNSTMFTTVFASGANPGPDPDCTVVPENGWNCWSSESALDIEMAHAMAPSAHIYLVEAKSTLYGDLFAAVKKAASLVAAAGGGEVSMSFGGGEFSGETSYDATFAGSHVVFFASTGDSEGTEYPSVSPKVVAVGGTTLSRSPNTLDIEAETAWEDGGGGYSQYEPQPSFQNVVFGTGTGFKRAVPDIAAVGNPRTGVWVYDSYQTPTGPDAYIPNVSFWLPFGGTSVASPLWAGVVNHAGSFAASSAAEESLLYANTTLSPNLRDVTYGTCGYYDGWFAVTYWDPCTGLGAPYGKAGK